MALNKEQLDAAYARINQAAVAQAANGYGTTNEDEPKGKVIKIKKHGVAISVVTDKGVIQTTLKAENQSSAEVIQAEVILNLSACMQNPSKKPVCFIGSDNSIGIRSDSIVSYEVKVTSWKKKKRILEDEDVDDGEEEADVDN